MPMTVETKPREVSLSNESRPYKPVPARPGIATEAMEGLGANRNRVLIGAAVALTVIVGALTWQYIDDRGAFPVAETQIDNSSLQTP